MQPGSHAASSCRSTPVPIRSEHRDDRFAWRRGTALLVPGGHDLCQPALLRGGVASPSAMRCVTSSVQPPAANANTRPSGLQA